RRQERSKSSNKRQLNYRRQETSRVRGTRHETPIKRYRKIKSDLQLQDIIAWSGDKNTDIKKETVVAKEKKAKMNILDQERILPVED
ncbi:14789_t:CDS:1, partial [Cetraspora pellucida]